MLLRQPSFTYVISVLKSSRPRPMLVSILARPSGSVVVRCDGTSRFAVCSARRRSAAVYDDDEDEEEYGYNKEIAMLEMYTESAPAEALFVKALVDNQEEQVLIFKGYSSCLTTYRTSPNPSRSILPARAIIKSIDRIKGPFDPSNIQYLEEGLSWETFKIRLSFNDP